MLFTLHRRLFMQHETINNQLALLNLNGMQDVFVNSEIDELNSIEQWQSLLLNMLESEIAYRQSRSFTYRLKLAKLPQIKTFEKFDWQYGLLEKQKIEKLCQCEFVQAKENIILIGGSGTGKTHIALALAHQLLQNQNRVRFYRFAELVRDILMAKDHHYEAQFMKRILRFPVLVIDELGYMPIGQQAGYLLFELLSEFYEKGALILTTHLTFDEWGELFGDKKSTKVMIDRLTHHCHLLETGNKSWRLKEVSENK